MVKNKKENSDKKMEEKKLITNKKLFLRVLFIYFFSALVVGYSASLYLKKEALNKLIEDHAEKTSSLVFKTIYTKMQDGWVREDIDKVVKSLNDIDPNLKINIYRSRLVEELFGKIDSGNQRFNDPLIQKALNGETVFATIDNNKIRYLKPIIIKQECIKCHVNTKEGDVNGVIDMVFPPTDIQAPLDSIFTYLFIFIVIAIVITFFILAFLISKMFISPLSRFVNQIKNVQENDMHLEEVKYVNQTYEMHMLEKSFNELLSKVNKSLEKLGAKNKTLHEYQKAIDKSTIVSKADLKGVITYVNDKFCEISGYTREELVGKNHNIVRSPNVPKEVFKELWETISHKGTWRGVVENRAKNGESYFVQATIMPILDENDEIVEYIGIRQDITELKKLQFKEITDSVDQALDIHFQEMVEYIPVSAVIVDQNSIIRFSNTIFNGRFSYLSREEMALDSLFIQKEGYVFNNSVLDWKDEVVNLEESLAQKVLIDFFGNATEYFIFVSRLDEYGLYFVLLIEADSNLESLSGF